jgi:predicted dehydrogenase
LTKNTGLDLALIGPGKWGINYLNTVDSIPNISIRHVLRQKNLCLPSPHQNIKIFNNHHDPEFLDGIDGIILACPARENLRFCEFFLKKEMPLIVEKPLCFSSKEADFLIKLAHSKNAFFLTNYIHLYNSHFTALLEWIRDEVIIKIIIKSGNKGPFRNDLPAFWDWLPHDLSILKMLLPNESFETLNLEVTKGSITGSNAHNIKWTMRSTNIPIFIESGNLFSEKIKLVKVYTTRGIFIWDDLNKDCPIRFLSSGTREEESKHQTSSSNPSSPLQNLLTNFTHLICLKEIPYHTMEFNIHISQLLEEGWNKLQSNCPG